MVPRLTGELVIFQNRARLHGGCPSGVGFNPRNHTGRICGYRDGKQRIFCEVVKMETFWVITEQIEDLGEMNS